MNAPRLPTVQELKAWVEKHPTGAEVGRCRRASLCLLSMYLLAHNPFFGQVVVDFDDRDHPDKPGGWVEVEVWPAPTTDGHGEEFTYEDQRELTNVLAKFDKLSGYDAPITREQALTCFEEEK